MHTENNTLINILKIPNITYFSEERHSARNIQTGKIHVLMYKLNTLKTSVLEAIIETNENIFTGNTL